VFACRAEEALEGSELQGIIEFDDRSLAFEVAGRLVVVSVEEGDVLKPGQELARLDDKLEQLKKASLEAEGRATKAQLNLLYAGALPEQLSQVRARLRAARAATTYLTDQHERHRVLFGHGVATQNELDRAANELEQAKGVQAEVEQQLAELRRGPRSQEIETAEAHLDAALSAVEASAERVRRHVLYVTSSAEVLDVPVKSGEYVSPGTVVATLADTSHPYVDVFVPQAQIGSFGVGAKVAVNVDTLSHPLGGSVEYVAKSTEFTPRFLFSPRERPNLVVRVRVRIHDPKHQLRAGIPAFLELNPKLHSAAFPKLSASSPLTTVAPIASASVAPSPSAL
jgi:HlyD family secretion protein